ncbi:oligosaccharide flippase family protein [Aeromonas veronii]|uniref:O-unit flippase-like protein n=1 Tax=Aeromonas veronii TaxID=654 RepID=UPI00191D39B5|nr:O-unit flippase-like protein [Aeromonas veronii]MBL0641768.1 oligosaccharide flippase family protein [Aeromonas veronii]
MKRTDLIWGYSAQLLNIGVGILLLPILVVTLNSEELGLWYVFMAMVSLAQLLEFGFQPTIARQAAYIYNGATEIKRSGLPATVSGELNIDLLVNLIHSSKYIYRWIAILVAVLLWGMGSLYIYTLNYAGDLTTAYMSWFLFASASVITFYFGYFNALLQGRGDITLVNKVVVASRVSYVLLAIVLLLLKFSLLAIAIASLISCIINRMLISRAFYNTKSRDFKKNKPTANLNKILWANTWRLGLVQFGAFLIQRGNMFIAATYLGLTVAASYGLTMQLSAIIVTLANQLMALQLPKMNALQAACEKNELKNIYASSVLVAFILLISGFAGLTLLGEPILALIGSETKLINSHLLALLGVVLLLETHHSISATYLTTTNQVPFLKAALVSGVGVTILSYALVYWCDLGVTGLIIGQGVVQLFFNNWYWPKVAMQHLNITPLELVSRGYKSITQMLVKQS